MNIPALRRPLVRSFTPFNHAATPIIGLPANHIHAPESRHRYEDLTGIAKQVGLAQIPQEKHYLSARIDPAQHETHFLQYGWATDNRRQTAFEIGDDKTIISMHFRKKDAAHDVWHLDTLEIDDGKLQDGEPVPCNLYCDDAQHDGHIQRIFAAVRGTVTLMHIHDWQDARDVLHDTLAPVIRMLDCQSQIEADDHEFYIRHDLGGVQGGLDRVKGFKGFQP